MSMVRRSLFVAIGAVLVVGIVIADAYYPDVQYTTFILSQIVILPFIVIWLSPAAAAQLARQLLPPQAENGQ